MFELGCESYWRHCSNGKGEGEAQNKMRGKKKTYKLTLKL
jgi:hypothetical protein